MFARASPSLVDCFLVAVVSRVRVPKIGPSVVCNRVNENRLTFRGSGFLVVSDSLADGITRVCVCVFVLKLLHNFECVLVVHPHSFGATATVSFSERTKFREK